MANNQTAGYYLKPAAWVGDVSPTSRGISGRDLAEVVLVHTLANGIEVRVQRQGLVCFDFAAWQPGTLDSESAQVAPDDVDTAFAERASAVANRVKLMNAHLICLQTSTWGMDGWIGPTVVGPHDMIFVRDDVIGGPGLVAPWGNFAGNVDLGDLGFMPELVRDWPRNTIPIDAMRGSCEKLDEILANRDQNRALDAAALFNRAVGLVDSGAYDLGLVASWTICEMLINSRWDDYIQGHRDRTIDGDVVRVISAKRRQRLTEDHDVTASIKSEFLDLLKWLPHNLYRDLNTVRKRRNAWLHNVDAIDFADASLAITAAQRMIEEVLNVRLEGMRRQGIWL